MNLWGVTHLLAAAMLGGGIGVHMPTGDHITQSSVYERSAGQAVPAGESVRQRAGDRQVGVTAPVPPVSLPGAGAPTPVLRQTGPASWETTVLLSDTSPGCADAKQPKKTQYWLAITPAGVDPGQLQSTKANTTAGHASGGSSCELTLRFTNLAQVPSTAALVIDQPSASLSITLTVSRDVTLFSYLGWPAIGGGIAVLLFLLSLLLVRTWDWDGEHKVTDPAWWGRPIVGSGAWTGNDSWATNISTGLVVVGAVLTAATAASPLFPGVALDRFSIVNVLAGAFVLAAPVVFGICYSVFTERTPGPTADSTVKLQRRQAATISVPSGATITMAADASIQESTANGPVTTVRAGCTYQIPPGARIMVQPDITQIAKISALEIAATDSVAAKLTAAYEFARRVASQIARRVASRAAQDELPDTGQAPTQAGEDLIRAAIEATIISEAVEQAIVSLASSEDAPGGQTAEFIETIAFSGTSDIGVLPSAIMEIEAAAGTWTIQQSDIVKPNDVVSGSRPSSQEDKDVPVLFPVLIAGNGGAKITVTGAADINLPQNSMISGPRQRDRMLRKSRWLLLPQGTNLIVANMGIMVAGNIFTMFGIGAELGIAYVLTNFSVATGPWRAGIYGALAALAALVLCYAITATRAMANPQPGSSISSQSGTSFTL